MYISNGRYRTGWRPAILSEMEQFPSEYNFPIRGVARWSGLCGCDAGVRGAQPGGAQGGAVRLQSLFQGIVQSKFRLHVWCVTITMTLVKVVMYKTLDLLTNAMSRVPVKYSWFHLFVPTLKFCFTFSNHLITIVAMDSLSYKDRWTWMLYDMYNGAVGFVFCTYITCANNDNSILN